MKKKQSVTILIESFITGVIMYFLPKEHWVYQAFMYWKLLIGMGGIILLIVIGILSAKEDTEKVGEKI